MATWTWRVSSRLQNVAVGVENGVAQEDNWEKFLFNYSDSVSEPYYANKKRSKFHGGKSIGMYIVCMYICSLLIKLKKNCIANPCHATCAYLLAGHRRDPGLVSG